MKQEMITGIRGIDHLLDGKKFLLVKDGAFDFLGIRSVFDKFPHAEFSGFTPNPLYEQVCEGVKIFNAEHCEQIVAVGGGSAIDVAKCIKLFCRMDPEVNYLRQEMADSGIPLIAVPTTAGTGSESTRHAVIYFEVHSTDESKEYSKRAIALIRENWEAYLFENTDAAAARIMEASNCAGRAINITATTAAHAMSYKITSLYRFPHGHAVAVCMPEVWDYLLSHTDDCIDGRGERYLRDTLAQISEMISLDQFRSMLAKMEMNYPKAGDKETEVDLLAKSVNPVRLKNNPVALSSDVLREMYRRIVQQ